MPNPMGDARIAPTMNRLSRDQHVNQFGKQQRRSIRLKHWDYTSPGLYFVTICINKQQCLLGDIYDNDNHHSAAGDMIDYWWRTLPSKFTSVQLDAYVIMPNHMHGIVFMTAVGADQRVRPDQRVDFSEKGQTHWSAPTNSSREDGLPRVIQWFKTMTTNEYIRNVHNLGWEPFIKRLWQRNYYESIVRNERHLNAIRDYIEANPASWPRDKYYQTSSHLQVFGMPNPDHEACWAMHALPLQDNQNSDHQRSGNRTPVKVWRTKPGQAHCVRVTHALPLQNMSIMQIQLN